MKLKLIIVFTALFLSCGIASATETNWTGLNPNLGSGTFINGVLVVAPSASKASDTYHASQSVTLTATGSNTIKYTTNGTDPACPSTGTLYGGAITVNSNTTLKAVACYKSDNSFSSATSSYFYNFTCATPSIDHGGVGSYPTCEISCSSGYALSGSSCVGSAGGFVGGGGAVSIIPTTFVTINNGATIANSQNVTLSLVATGASFMMISNLSNFSDVTSWEAFTASKSWVLTAGDGVKTVYVKFRTTSGNEYSAVSDSITLQVGAIIATSTIQTATTTLTVPSLTTPTSVHSFISDLQVGSTGISVTELQKILVAGGYLIMPKGVAYGNFLGMTKTALIKYKIANGIIPTTGTVNSATRAKLNTLVVAPVSNQVVTKSSTGLGYIFKVTLRLNSKGVDVTALQKILVAGGYLVMPAGTTYGNFGSLTEKALGKYQVVNNIIKPGEPGYGTLGPKTRAKLNQ